MTKLMSNRAIRRHLGSGEGNRMVRITQEGEVHYYGSRDHADRDHDYWHSYGVRADYPADGNTPYHV